MPSRADLVLRAGDLPAVEVDAEVVPAETFILAVLCRWGCREVGQLDSGFVNSDTTLVALAIGGNDAEFANTLASCANPLDNCPSDATDKIPQLLADIYDRAPNAKIILQGYRNYSTQVV